MLSPAKLLPQGDRAIERAEAVMLRRVQPPTFLKHHFAPGIYVREIWMPKGSIILGHRHLTEHLNIVVSGSCLVRMEEGIHRILAGPAPVTFKSGAGVRKALFILEDTTWMTVHANPGNITDIATLESMLVAKSPAYTEHEARQAMHELGEAS